MCSAPRLVVPLRKSRPSGTPRASTVWCSPRRFASACRWRRSIRKAFRDLPSYSTSHPQALAIFTGNKRDAGQRERRGAVLAQPIAISLAEVKAPTLVLAGREDRLIPPAHTLSLACEIAGARTAVVDGVGHVGTIQDPAAVAAEVIDFLQSKKPEDIVEESDDGGIQGGSRLSL